VRLERNADPRSVHEYFIAHEGADLGELRRWVETNLAPALRGLPGVAGTTVAGGPEHEVDVVADVRRLAGLGLSTLEVWAALRAAPTSLPVAALGTVALRLPSGETVTLNEVAHIETRWTEPLRVRRHGRAGIVLRVEPAPSASGAPLAERIAAQLAWLHSNRLVPDGTRIEPLAGATRALRRAMGEVLGGVASLTAIAALVVGALGARRGVFRAMLLAAAAAAPVVAGMALSGLALTPLRLAGLGLGATLVLCLGAVAQRSGSAWADPGASAPARRASLSAWLAVASAFTLLALWLAPFREPIGLAAAVLGAGWLARFVAVAAGLGTSSAPMSARSALGGARRRLGGAALALLAGGFLVWNARPATATLDETDRTVITLATADRLADSEWNAVLAEVQTQLAAESDIDPIMTVQEAPQVGVAQSALTLMLAARDPGRIGAWGWSLRVAKLLARLEAKLPTWRVVRHERPRADAAIRLELTGSDPAELARLASAAAHRLRTTPGVVRAAVRERSSVATFEVLTDPERLAELGLHAADVERAVSIARGGLLVGGHRDGEAPYGLHLRLPRVVETAEQLAGVLLAGEFKHRPAVLLGAIAQSAWVAAPAEIDRVNGEYAVELSALAEATQRDTAAVRAALGAQELPPGFRLRHHPPEEAVAPGATELAAAAVLIGLLMGLATLIYWRRPRAILAVLACGLLVPGAVAMLALFTGPVSPLGWLGVILVGPMAGVAAHLGVGARHSTRDDGSIGGAAGPGLLLLAPLALGLAPWALGWLGPDVLADFAGLLAGGCLVAAACLMAWRVRRVRQSAL
jgi:HAE1 family hydrophobic/amphiphilic exporter-1